jgi:Tfp pilus assembly protein PilX
MKRDEQGIALVITLFLMASLSALAVSMMFLSQTETASSRNYRTMSQARYAGEAGIHKAINYLNSPNYVAATMNYANFDLTKSPVRCVSGCTRISTACDPTSVTTMANTNCVVLAADFTGLTSNYPDATVTTAFDTTAATAAKGTLAVNGSGVTNNNALGTVSFGTYAILMSMRSYNGYGTGTLAVQTWQIVSDGKAGPTGSLATVEVMSTFEKAVVPAETFAVFATDTTCGAITYEGSGKTDSYNSGNALGGNGKPVTSDAGGSVGTNGNLTLKGTVDIYGNLSTPRTGVGDCGDGAVTAVSGGIAQLHGETIHLPQAKVYPDPVIPNPGVVPDLDLSSISSLATCLTKMGAVGWTCAPGSGLYNGFWVISPISGNTLNCNNLNIGSNTKIVIGGGSTADIIVNANSFTTAGNTTLAITNAKTTMNLRGTDVSPVMDMQGNFSTTAFDPTKLQIMYAGTGTIKLRGSNELAATVYAPNAYVDLSSSYAVYGSILAFRYNNSGGATVHYDNALATKYFMISNPFMSTFTWKKY